VIEAMPMRQNTEKGDIFVTLMGNLNVIVSSHSLSMKDEDGVIFCNIAGILTTE
jgi:adenosylhomocysteinase